MKILLKKYQQTRGVVDFYCEMYVHEANSKLSTQNLYLLMLTAARTVIVKIVFTPISFDCI